MYEQERKQLAEKLSHAGIYDENILKAIAEVERHLFVPDALVPHAYKDVALPIGFGQTISQPYTVAVMTQAMKLKKDSKVLEIGTGSGYQSALLCKMGMKVYTIERQNDIFIRTQKLFDKLGIRAATRLGDGTLGWNEYAPYDGIIVTAGAPSVPPTLKRQLAIGGRLVIPVGDKISQNLVIVTKLEEDKFETEEIPRFAFVPLIGREGWDVK